MPRTRIKICGICRPEDALLAARYGTDAIGLVFHPSSPRAVNLGQAREIIQSLPPFVTPVALFVDSPTQTILDTVQSLHIRHVQLHGHETPQQIQHLPGLSIIKAIKVHRDSFAADLDGWRKAISKNGLPNLCALLLETAGELPGGTGQENDWNTIRQAHSSGLFDGLPPIIAAGGLTPQNVASVVHDLHPYAVDVSSSVEESPGRKSDAKIREFVAAVQQAG